MLRRVGLSGCRKAGRAAPLWSQLRTSRGSAVSIAPRRERASSGPPSLPAAGHSSPSPRSPRWSRRLYRQARPRGGGGGLEAVAGSARVTESGAMEPSESGKVGLEGRWGRLVPPFRSLIWAAARRAVRAEALRMTQPCRQALARSPAASSSALGRVARGGADAPARALRRLRPRPPRLAEPSLPAAAR